MGILLDAGDGDVLISRVDNGWVVTRVQDIGGESLVPRRSVYVDSDDDLGGSRALVELLREEFYSWMQDKRRGGLTCRVVPKGYKEEIWGLEKREVGVDLICEERRRQIREEGLTLKYNQKHIHDELVWAAICYAAPRALLDSGEDHWPWEHCWDKRPRFDDGGLKPAGQQTFEERKRCLVKAGALIAAEIDRMQEAEEGAADD